MGIEVSPVGRGGFFVPPEFGKDNAAVRVKHSIDQWVGWMVVVLPISLLRCRRRAPGLGLCCGLGRGYRGLGLRLEVAAGRP